jgi:hypothetical protein
MTNEQVWYLLSKQLESFDTILREVTNDLLKEYPEIETEKIPDFWFLSKQKDIVLFEKLYQFLSSESQRIDRLLGDKNENC